MTLTYPLIGNYGVNPEDVESGKIQVEGFIVRELCEEPSNWRSSLSLRDYLGQNSIVSMQGIDTRALTRHLRVAGVMMGAMSTELTRAELMNALQSAPNYGDLNFVERVSTKETYEWTGDECSKLSDLPEPKCHIALVDLGIKRNIARCLAKECCKVTVLPCNASADDVMRLNPDGVVFSPGPGDPRRAHGYRRDHARDDRQEADSGNLPRPPDVRDGDGRRILSSSSSAIRGANHPGEEPHQRQGEHHGPEPRLRRPARQAVQRCNS